MVTKDIIRILEPSRATCRYCSTKYKIKCRRCVSVLVCTCVCVCVCKSGLWQLPGTAASELCNSRYATLLSICGVYVCLWLKYYSGERNALSSVAVLRTLLYVSVSIVTADGHDFPLLHSMARELISVSLGWTGSFLGIFYFFYFYTSLKWVFLTLPIC